LTDPAAAAARLDGFRSGWVDAGEVIGERLLVVDADRAGPVGCLSVPVGFPAIVAAVSGADPPDLSADGPDVALTTASDPPAPWVSVPDADAAVDDLARRIDAAPGAAVTLVEVLRGFPGRSVEEGLLAESTAYSMLQAGPEFGRWRASRGLATPRPASDPAILVDRSGGELRITLNRPDVHNAYNRQMRDELCEVLAAALAEPSLTVRLSGAGPSFCSGGDLDEFGTSPDPVTAHVVRTGRSPARLLAALADRTEVVVHGSCAGSGIELPAFAARVQARPDTRIWLPELAMGLIPGAGGTVSLPRRIGRGRTAWLGLSGERLDAVTARRWGLVEEVLSERE
jgi:enoyl-CoA hydratase/carnithine racemase